MNWNEQLAYVKQLNKDKKAAEKKMEANGGWDGDYVNRGRFNAIKKELDNWYETPIKLQMWRGLSMSQQGDINGKYKEKRPAQLSKNQASSAGTFINKKYVSSAAKAHNKATGGCYGY